jgi:enolase
MYHLEADNKTLTSQEMVDFLEDVCNTYPIISIEDGLSEEDWEGWKFLTKKIGHRTQLVGDDIFATSPQRLRKAIDMGVANAIIIKPNQIGTVTEAIETVNLAKAAGYGTILSARSGEIGDPFLSHFVVGQSIGQGKLTSFDGDEHIRLNEILRIEEYLGQRGTYAGRKVLSRFMS